MDVMLASALGTVILCHLYISWIYIFEWDKKGRTLHRSVPKTIMKSVKKQAFYLGIVCLCLACGLICSFFTSELISLSLRLFILTIAFCTALVFTLVSHSNRIFIVQGLPALIALTFSII